jgi:hypothetical protein
VTYVLKVTRVPHQKGCEPAVVTRQDMRDIAAAKQAAGDTKGAQHTRKMAELRIAYYICRHCGKKHRHERLL